MRARMDYEKTTSMRCSEELLDELDDRKDRSQSYEDYLWTLLEGRHTPDPEPAQSNREPVHDRRDPEPMPDPEPEPAVRETDPLEHVSWPGNHSAEECKAAVRAARDYIEEHDGARKSEIVRAVLPEHPAGYDVVELDEDERYRGRWWDDVVAVGLDALPDVQKPVGGGKWRVK